jgi:hypothetical protein
MPLNAGAGPHFSRPEPPYRPPSGRPERYAAAALGCRLGPLLQGVAHGFEVVRDIALDDVGEVERQRDGQDDDDGTADRAEGPLVTPEGPESLGQAAARQREGEQRDRGADGEAQG